MILKTDKTANIDNTNNTKNRQGRPALCRLHTNRHDVNIYEWDRLQGNNLSGHFQTLDDIDVMGVVFLVPGFQNLVGDNLMGKTYAAV